MLLDVLDAVMLDNRIAVALVCHDRKRHTVHWATRRADQHDRRVVLVVASTYVAVPLDRGVGAQALRDHAVEHDLGRFAQTEDAHVVVGMPHLRNHEACADEGLRAVYDATFAFVAHDTGSFSRETLAHVLFLVSLGYLYDRLGRVACWILRKRVSGDEVV